ncbi:MAG: hypothetical protein CVU89_08430 [Firmicutes bacterium HGW-Firmicutes-14]|nr:MAG: hypothetical protein CVU89_08430 [Firmicutes bacterium HGW-Firmicutes-14]
MIANLALFIIFLIVAACILWKLDLTIGLLAAGVAIGLMLSDYWAVLDFIALAVSDIDNLTIILTIYLIQVLRCLLGATDVMNKITENLRGLIKSYRSILILMPFIFAVIPGAGATLLSAALVDEYTKNLDISPTTKAYTNFWFRSTVQFTSPITFAFVTLTGILTVKPSVLVLNFLPLSLIMLAAGYMVEIRHISINIPGSGKEEKRRFKQDLAAFLINTSFIWLILFSFLILRIPLEYSLIGAIILFIFQHRLEFKTLVWAMKKGLSWSLFGLIMGVFFLQVVVTETELMSKALVVWQRLGIHEFLLAVIFSFIIGYGLGSYVGAIALSFTLFGGMTTNIQQIVIIYTLTRIGCYVSPVNSALLFNLEFFGGDMGQFLKRIGVSLIPLILYLVLLALIFIKMR